MKITFGKSVITFFSIVLTFYFSACQNDFLINTTNFYKVTFVSKGSVIDSYRTNIIKTYPGLTDNGSAEFGGWYDNEYCIGDAISFPYELTKDTTLYAKWDNKYWVYFETDEGTEIEPRFTTEIKECPITTRDGYDFAYWLVGVANPHQATFPYELTNNTTFYAVWLKIYTVSFETNGGERIAPFHESIITTAPITTKSGYTFVGWYEDSSLKNRVTFPYELKADTKLYARWKYGISTADCE